MKRIWRAIDQKDAIRSQVKENVVSARAEKLRAELVSELYGEVM
ncbi:MAG: hypothetical protein Q4F28_10845 [Eubacteriales bacterium]|nr:hypothetical protein [Eubacteriales bacterium]